MFNRVHRADAFSDGIHQPESKIDLPLELRELMAQQPSVSSAAHDSDWPVSLFVPEHYEENYAYPLIVWFHAAGQNEGQLESVISAISSQNYCGLGIQGNMALSNDKSFDWNSELLEHKEVPLQDLLSVTIRRLRKVSHIHSERIFLAGAGTGADVALQQLAQTPDWYAGALLFSPSCGTCVVDSLASSSLNSKSILWTVSRTASSEQLAHNVEAVQLARLAGAEPELRVTETAIDPESSDIRFVDHWLLTKIRTETFA
jgi:phospholipase/carboxylesterase